MFGGASKDGPEPTERFDDLGNQDEAEINLHHILSDVRYSPAALHRLPQPVPNNLPSDVDGTVFTYADAFEDLLAEARTGHLPDIRQRYHQRKMLSGMFQHGEPQEFMRRRLEAQGLLPDYQKAASEAFALMRKDYERRVKDTWKNYEELYRSGGSGEVLAKLYDTFGFPKGSRDDPWNDWGYDEDPSKRHRGKRHEPNNFEEMFDTVHSMVESGQRTWDTFMKSFENHTPSWPQNEPPHQREPHQEPKTTEERDEYIDKFGYVHSTVIRRQYDNDGNEIGRSTSSRIYPAPKSAGEHEQLQGDHSEDNRRFEDDEKKKLGWFWK